MKHLAAFISGLLFMLLLGAGLRHVFGIVQKAIAGGGIRGMVLWQNDWDQAIAEGVARNKLVLVEFARESSPHCQELAKKGWSRMNIADAASDYVPVLVDIDAHPDLAKRFGIATLPSLVLIDAKTQTIVRDGRDQTFSPDDLLLWLKPDAQPQKWDLSTPLATPFDAQKNPFVTSANP
jgi:hypothetical protein